MYKFKINHGNLIVTDSQSGLISEKYIHDFINGITNDVLNNLTVKLVMLPESLRTYLEEQRLPIEVVLDYLQLKESVPNRFIRELIAYNGISGHYNLGNIDIDTLDTLRYKYTEVFGLLSNAVDIRTLWLTNTNSNMDRYSILANTVETTQPIDSNLVETPIHLEEQVESIKKALETIDSGIRSYTVDSVIEYDNILPSKSGIIFLTLPSEGVPHSVQGTLNESLRAVVQCILKENSIYQNEKPLFKSKLYYYYLTLCQNSI